MWAEFSCRGESVTLVPDVHHPGQDWFLPPTDSQAMARNVAMDVD